MVHLWTGVRRTGRAVYCPPVLRGSLLEERQDAYGAKAPSLGSHFCRAARRSHPGDGLQTQKCNEAMASVSNLQSIPSTLLLIERWPQPRLASPAS